MSVIVPGYTDDAGVLVIVAAAGQHIDGEVNDRTHRPADECFDKAEERRRPGTNRPTRTDETQPYNSNQQGGRP